MKIVFFGTANVALPILEALKKEHEILAVVTTPDQKAGRNQEFQESPVSALAVDLKLPLLKPENVKGNPDFFSQLKNLAANIFVVVAYGKIFPNEIINLPQFKAINVHFSVLPKYRGPAPMQFALLNGDEYTGTSIFVLDEEPDHGPMLAQQVVKIEPDDNYLTLSDRLAHTSAKMINAVIADYTSRKITPLPQDESAATHTTHISKADGKIDWNKSATQIYNQFRAFYPWPGIWTTWKGTALKVTECAPTSFPVAPNSAPGAVLGQGVVVCGNQTTLQISRLQLAGKSETGILDFLNGYSDFVGSKLD